MFKKRNTSNKSVNISQSITDTSEQSNSQNTLLKKPIKIIEQHTNINNKLQITTNKLQLPSNTDTNPQQPHSTNPKTQNTNNQLTLDTSSSPTKQISTNTKLSVIPQNIKNHHHLLQLTNRNNQIDTCTKSKQFQENNVQKLQDQLQELYKSIENNNYLHNNHNIYQHQNNSIIVQHEQYNPFNNTSNSQQQYINPPEYISENDQQLQQQYHQISKANMSRNEIVIDDDSQQQRLQVVQDYGDIDDDQDSQSNQNCYQNQIIKKTLPKSLYQTISKQMQNTVTQNKNKKILKQLQQISNQKIQKKINKDLKKRINKSLQLDNQLKFIQNKIVKKSKEIQQKKNLYNNTDCQFDKIKRIAQILFYFGDQITFNTYEDLVKLSEDQVWLQKINTLRKHMRKRAQQIQNKKQKTQKQQNQNNQNNQIDVQQIPKSRRILKQNWNQQIQNYYDQQYDQSLGKDKEDDEEDQDDDGLMIDGDD